MQNKFHLLLTWETHLNHHEEQISIRFFCINFLKKGQNKENNMVNICLQFKSEFGILQDI